ncbi:MAG: hypothetical protein GX606_01375 [Elusimicrobia bacterium]|nr:hypothetical protein [Elusimicrobiota bacterium]
MDVFGGGFLYSMGEEYLAVGLILGLDWPYVDLEPQRELEFYKTHPFVAQFLKGATIVSAGAKTIPEGGWFSLPMLWARGALLVGDAAGLVNMEKIKGLHNAIRSGMAAADAILDGDLAAYPQGLETRGVLSEMRHARNFRQAFRWGLLTGMPLSLVSHLLPFRIPAGKDHEATCATRVLARQTTPVLDRAAFAGLANTSHREDAPSHLVIVDPEVCARCQTDMEAPCTRFCPTEVYRLSGERLHVSATNCVHCGTCAVKCPYQNIVWTSPEGGQGPRYKMM